VSAYGRDASEFDHRTSKRSRAEDFQIIRLDVVVNIIIRIVRATESLRGLVVIRISIKMRTQHTKVSGVRKIKRGVFLLRFRVKYYGKPVKRDCPFQAGGQRV